MLVLLGVSDFKEGSTIRGFFLDILKKNSSPKKLKTQANSHEKSSKISEKLKNHQLNLSFYNVKVAFSFQKCAAG